MNTFDKGAEFSDDGKYRYVLWRRWDQDKPIAMCVGLNPSTANAEKDDPTITRLVKTLDHLGYGGLKMTNLLALITSKPEKLSESPDPVGNNWVWLTTTAYSAQEIIFCWGAFKQAVHYGKVALTMFPDAKCFGRNKNGSPWHPRALTYIKGPNASKVKLERYL